MFRIRTSSGTAQPACPYLRSQSAMVAMVLTGSRLCSATQLQQGTNGDRGPTRKSRHERVGCILSLICRLITLSRLVVRYARNNQSRPTALSCQLTSDHHRDNPFHCARERYHASPWATSHDTRCCCDHMTSWRRGINALRRRAKGSEQTGCAV